MVYRRDFRRQQPPTEFFSRWSVTHLIIFVTVITFFLFLILSFLIPSIMDFVAIKPSLILSGMYLWTIVTSIFMHAGFFHLFVNMFSLFFLGSLVEKIIGRRRFIWFYLIAGVVGSLFFVLFTYLGGFVPRGDFIFGGVDDFAVGASGAIFGLLGILATLLPRKKIYLIVGPLLVIVLQFSIGPFVSGSMGNVVNIASTILIFLMIFSMFSPSSSFRRISMPLSLSFWLAPIVAIVPLLIVGFFVKLPIGNMAHLGGLVAGLIYGAYLRGKYKQKVKMLNRMIK
ncbi:MAG: rhomboid family intramembrane serine protease [Nanoarchaeota archaeon]